MNTFPILLMLFLTTTLLKPAPRPPYQIILLPDVIQELPVSGDVTLLYFPEDVTLILGKGLTDGTQPGKVRYQHAKNARLIVLQQVEGGADVSMKLMVGGEPYVFRVISSENPATVIRFCKEKAFPPAKEVTVEQHKKTKRPVSKERMAELFKLAFSADTFREKVPQEYQGYQSREVKIACPLNSNLTVEIRRLARFGKEDALICIGKLHNRAKASFHTGELGKLSLQVGGNRLYRAGDWYYQSDHPVIRSGEEIWVGCVLIGDGKGNPLHLSLDNDFSLKLKP